MELPISTSVRGIDWPALPLSPGAGKLATLFQLEQSQWWPQDRLRKHQFTQIDALLRHCVAHVPYYRDLLGRNIAADRLQELWHTIPLLTRDRLQQAGDRLRSEMLPNSHGTAVPQRTSGSTGKPVEVLSTGITQFFWMVSTLRDHVWHRRDLSGKLAVIRYNQDERARAPGGIAAANWGSATAGVMDTGACAMINIHTPISEQLAWLQRENPDYLLTHPSVLQELALHCQRDNIQFPSLREVRTISEALPDGLRELCREVWGVPLVDMYTTIELGYLALQCPEHEHYHIQSENVLVEVLDESGQPCAPGQVGKVVVTNLHNYATPLIRYEVGDYAEVGEPCSCGRGLPVLKRILGRYRSLVTLPGGERRWPKFRMGEILKIAPVRQFQAIQHSIEEVEFSLVVKRPLSEDEKNKLSALFRDNLHPEINIKVSEVNEIPRSASGKYEEFISKL